MFEIEEIADNVGFTHNVIGDDGAAALGECLKYNKSLTMLDLNYNEIGDDGVAALVVT